MSEHTKTPWKAGVGNYGGFPFKGRNDWFISGAEPTKGSSLPFSICHKVTEADATFIVRACNNFDGLLEALKNVVANSGEAAAWERARAAIDKAEAE